ncbi:MAG: oxygenase [Symploca sp. SIO1C4]|uniref:Oxygenase n=1 Tax=Symploca sp. SIO1C4 TaxID=2607765 RepID=A0A6B3NK72_9CYAN|nr:oxygenase [Symploca sp. SIO1C4]
MRRIGIIGAGQAGLYLGISLVDAGYAVTLFSEFTLESILNGKLMATPNLLPDALQLERQLGLAFWDDQFPGCNQLCNDVCDSDGNLALVVSSTLERCWQAVDQRLKFSCWMQEFVRRGGELVIRTMTPRDLEECVQNYDLVVVSTGRGSLKTLFERDAQRSIHGKPKRHLAAVIVTGLKGESMAEHTIKLTTLPGIGEIFQFPFYDKSKNSSHTIFFEAHPGGTMDRFSQIQSGQQLLEVSKKLMEQLTPWDYEVIKDMELTDELAWLRGVITPTVRQPVGRLPDGARVMGIGDAVILNDPIAGQGANNATKMAHLVVQRIIDHGNRRFDESWMQAVFDEFWEYCQYANALADCLLTPPAHLQELVVAMAQNPEVARDYINGVNHPPSLFPWFFEPEETKKYLAQKNTKGVGSDYSTSQLSQTQLLVRAR